MPVEGHLKMGQPSHLIWADPDPCAVCLRQPEGELPVIACQAACLACHSLHVLSWLIGKDPRVGGYWNTACLLQH